jgi:hypothetical protein
VDLVDFVFPDSAMLFKIDHGLVDKCRVQLKGTSYNWSSDSKEKSEKLLAKFLNAVCKAIATVSGKPALRVWDASYRNTPLQGSPIRRKPDVVLLDHDFKGTPEWQNVHSVAEVTGSKYEHNMIICTVTDKSYIMLGVQPNRIFVPIISAWAQTKFRLTVTDHQGQLHTITFDIRDGVRHADMLVLI